MIVLVALGSVAGAFAVGLLVALAVMELDWRIRSRRARRPHGRTVDLTGPRPS